VHGRLANRVTVTLPRIPRGGFTPDVSILTEGVTKGAHHQTFFVAATPERRPTG
jgi:hypothetical protein